MYITPQMAYRIASNIRDGDNPPYTVDDFRAAMPAFTVEIIPDAVLSGYVEMANAIVKEARWHSLWREGMRLFIAHFVTLYLETPPPPATLEEILDAGTMKGAVSSESVDGVSVSYDNSSSTSDLTGWAAMKLTTYGVQYATLARLLAKGGMYVR